MKLLKQVAVDKKSAPVLEDAAVGAGSIGASPMPLFSTLISRTKQLKPKIIKFSRRSVNQVQKHRTLRLKETFGGETSDGSSADSGAGNAETDAVISKLKGLEKRDQQDRRDTSVFGLEDDDGNIVRVSVKSEQAGEFERALQSFVTGESSEDNGLEIAEILFKLKDHFDIVDVQWPDVQEDEEQVTDLSGKSNEPAPEGEEGSPTDQDIDLDSTSTTPIGDDQTQSLLTQVIDMMRADAEARKADADARKAEAKAKEADAVVSQSMARVKQEEQYLDMETYNKSKKDETREAKRLAQLAKWKHDLRNDNDQDEFDSRISNAQSSIGQRNQPAEEEEQTNRNSIRPKASNISGRLHPHDIADFILNRVKK